VIRKEEEGKVEEEEEEERRRGGGGGGGRGPRSPRPLVGLLGFSLETQIRQQASLLQEVTHLLGVLL
jgi:hypothetical protein